MIAFAVLLALSGAGSIQAQDSTILSDLPEATLEALSRHPELLSDETPPALALEAIFTLTTPYRFENGPLVVETDSRWFATLPPGGAGAAILELRRWPGDSVMSLYALDAGREGPPPVPGADLSRLAEQDAAEEVWDGTVETSAGSRPVLWIERKIGEGLPRLGVLMMPGDAGIGSDGIPGVTSEMISVWRRVEIREAAWKARRPVPADQPVRIPATLVVPGDIGENDAPWQVVRGQGFTMGLPPGFRARRMDGSVPPPRPLEGGLLWFRGRCVDVDDEPVAVGDGNRFGYVARVALSQEWSSGKLPPLPIRGAEVRRIASEPFSLAADRTKASSVSVERWKEPGFDGEWLIFRLRFREYGYEIGMPVLAGRESITLYWIPATWRGDNYPPAPPPVDPAERFGIKFERLTRSARQQQPWVEGFLTTPDLRAEVSRGIYPAASLRSSDGYPIRLVMDSGGEVGILVRLDAEQVAALAEQLVGLTEVEKPGRFRASRVLRDETNSHLFIANEGHGLLFEFAPADAAVDGAEGENVPELWELMMRSVRLRSP